MHKFTVFNLCSESFICKWIYNIGSPKIDSNQFGNIKVTSTTLLLFHQWLSSCDNQRIIIHTCMIDFLKAFDLIDYY